MKFGIEKKFALVCGGSSGIGLAVAKELACEGTKVLIVSRSSEKLAQAVREIMQHIHMDGSHDSKPEVMTFACDISRADGCQQLIDHLKSQCPTVDILINNVGGPPPSAAAATTIDAWRTGFDQLFMSTTTLTQALLPAMREQKWGRIITITSTSVIEPIDHLAVSSSMRSAVTAFSKTLAREVAVDNITVNTVMPGIIHTGRIESLRAAKAEREGTTMAIEMDKSAKEIPARRMGRPEELAALVAFLASDRAGYITGQQIAVDGGASRSI